MGEDLTLFRDEDGGVRHSAYPCQESASLIFAYLGPGAGC
jgi:hypothetical protein